VVSFFFIFYALEFFIYRKIKLIYKTIHSLKTQRYSSVNSLFKKFDWDSDPISEVNQEVITWAKDKKEEIDHLKKLADFRKEFAHQSAQINSITSNFTQEKILSALTEKITATGNSIIILKRNYCIGF